MQLHKTIYQTDEKRFSTEIRFFKKRANIAEQKISMWAQLTRGDINPYPIFCIYSE